MLMQTNERVLYEATVIIHVVIWSANVLINELCLGSWRGHPSKRSTSLTHWPLGDLKEILDKEISS